MLYLASASPRRADILKGLGVKFYAIPNALKEEVLSEEPLADALVALAFRKAATSAWAYRDQMVFPAHVLAADTLVVGESLLGKPGSSEEAVEMLQQLSGKVHKVITAFSLLHLSDETVTMTDLAQSCDTGFDVTAVTCRDLSISEIRAYVRQYQVLDKAGAYGIQDTPLETHPLISSIAGSYFTVMGLPVERLLPLFEKCGILPVLTS